jgi:hypothetical protein
MSLSEKTTAELFKITLDEAELISGEQYLKLESPEFIGQTRMDKDNRYYMVWKSEGLLYKTLNKL